MTRIGAAFCLSLLVGCYTSVMPPGDAAGGDAPRGPCDPVGSMLACSPECGGHMACPESSMEGAYSCRDGLCVRWLEPYLPKATPLDLYCDLPTGDRDERRFSHRGDHACSLSRDRSGGITISEADCEALFEVRGERCTWSDGTERTRTPEPIHATCPAVSGPDSMLCGGPCGSCDYTGGWSTSVACVGRNDDRDLGVCALEVDPVPACSPDVWASTLCDSAAALGRAPFECVCLSFMREDGFERAGWVVPVGNCTTYRSLYPGEVECYGDDWTPVP